MLQNLVHLWVLFLPIHIYIYMYIIYIHISICKASISVLVPTPTAVDIPLMTFDSDQSCQSNMDYGDGDMSLYESGPTQRFGGKHDMNKQHRIHMYAHCECWAICIWIHLMHRFQLLRFCWRSILGIQLARAMVKTTGESSSSRLRTRDTRSGSTGTGWAGWI